MSKALKSMLGKFQKKKQSGQVVVGEGTAPGSDNKKYFSGWKPPVIAAVAFGVAGTLLLVSSFAATTSFTGRINSRKPARVHWVTVDNEGVTTATLKDTGGSGTDSVRFILRLRDSSGRVLASAEAIEPRATVTLAYSLKPGKYSYRVLSKDSLTRAGTTYQLDVNTPDAQPPNSDTQKPTVSVSQPQPGATVSGSVAISGTAADNVAVTAVKYRLSGGNWINAVGTSTWTGLIDTVGLPNGQTTLEVQANDAIGNFGVAVVSLTISNTNGGGTNPPPPTSSCPNTSHTPGGPDGMGGCWPYAGNTGVPAGTALTAYGGPCSIRTNTTIENKTVNCALQIYDNASLTIRKSVVNGFVENTASNGTGKLLIEDSKIDSGAWSDGSVWGSYITVNRSEISGGQHNVHCENYCTITNSYLHDQYNPAGGSYHNNAFLSNGGNNNVLRHNTLHCTAILNNTDGGCTGDLTLLGDFDVISYTTVDANLLMANNSSISFCTYGGYSPGKPYPNAHHVVYTNNVFQRGANSKCGVYGPVTSFQTTATGNQWTNNKWSDGAILNP